jgi:glucokinase
MLLAGDVGGTKTSLGLFDESRPGTPRVAHARVASREAGSLEAAIDEFLGAHGRPRIDAACFGVAGPVVEGRVATTNLPWQLDERELARAIPTRRVRLLNDLEAAGYGVLLLGPDELAELQPGQPREGHRVLIAAGTGLGQALLIWQQGHHHVVASEGGHGDFAPRDQREDRLLAHLRRERGRVSYEDVLSGPGLVATYRFLRREGPVPEPAWLTAELAEEDTAHVISEVARGGRDPVCAAALDVFVSVYGAEAGNLALKAVAVGGVIVGGGIAPKILSALADGAFIRAFRDKGRMAKLMADIPVRVALNPETALLGAASVAKRLLAEG